MNLIPTQTYNYILVEQIQDPGSGQHIPLVDKGLTPFQALFKPKPIVKPKINFNALQMELCTALHNHGVMRLNTSQGVYGIELQFQVYHSYQKNKVDIENINGIDAFVSHNDTLESSRPYCSTLKIPVQRTYIYLMDKYPVVLLMNENFILFNDVISHQNVMLNHWYIQFNNKVEVNYFVQRMGLLLSCI